MFQCERFQEEIYNKNNNFSILIVEDSRIINNTLTKTFQEKGFTCFQSYNLNDAEEILQKNDISLLILDLHLPDGEGEDLIIEIQETNKNTKIVIFTSDNDLSRRDELFRLGILDYVLKGKSANLIIKDILNIIKNIQINPNYNILVVDDSIVIRKMISKILRPSGYNILEAKSGPVALEMIALNNIDLILLDMEMAEMGGMDVLKNIKKEEQHFHLPVFIISSNLNIETMRNAYKEGALDYFKKPFSPEELKLKVEQVIKQKQNEVDLRCSIEVSNLCNKFLNEFYANAIFYANSKMKWANNQFFEYFGENSTNLLQAFKLFNQKDIQDIIISMKEKKSFKNSIIDKNGTAYIIKLFPLQDSEFLLAVEKVTKA